MLYYLALGMYVLVCRRLLLVGLLPQGKGGDIATAFGGGTSQAAFGARSGATVLSRATTVAAVLFMLGALALGILGQRGPGSVIGGRAPLRGTQAPAAPGPTQKPTTPPADAAKPATPAPATPAPATPPPAEPAKPPR